MWSGNCLKILQWLEVNISSAQRNSVSFGSWMEAETVSHMNSEDTGYLFLSWAWTRGSFKPREEERQLSIWRLRERAFQEEGRASPKALGGGAWCFWGTARRSEWLGHWDICFAHYSKAHLREEETGTQRGCDLHDKWQKPEFRSSSSEPKPCVFIKTPFCVYFQIASHFLYLWGIRC